jgi:hypothetical protein
MIHAKLLQRASKTAAREFVLIESLAQLIQASASERSSDFQNTT